MVVISPIFPNERIEFWQLGQMDEKWPPELQCADEFEIFLQNYQLSEFFGEGEFLVIREDDKIAGFMNIHLIPEHHFVYSPIEKPIRAMDCGTYLFENYRGMGINSIVKAYSIMRCFAKYQVDYCTFTIPTENTRALLALKKLPWFFEQITLETTFHELYPYLKWKSWKTQTPCRLFAIKRPTLFPQ